MMEQERIGATLRALRELRGFKPDQFASELGMSRSHLQNIESGRKKLSQVNLARAAELLDVPQIAIMRSEDLAATA